MENKNYAEEMEEYEDFPTCKFQYKSGFKKNQVCGKYECLTHNEYGGNIAYYLGLPEIFIEICEYFKKEFYYFDHVYIFELSSKGLLERIEIIHYIRSLFTIIDNMQVEHRDIILIYMFIFLDTESSQTYIMNNAEFKNIADNKMLEFLNSIEIEQYFLKKYLKDNFVTGKRFFSINKNKEYIRRTFRLYILYSIRLMKILDETLMKSYAPGGAGFNRAFMNFSTTCKLQVIRSKF